MERARLVELLESVRSVREAVFRMEQTLLEVLSEERALAFEITSKGVGPTNGSP